MTVMRLAGVFALTVLLAACGQAGGKGGRVDGERLAAANANGEWLAVGRTYDEQRYSPLDKINISNVKDLGLA